MARENAPIEKGCGNLDGIIPSKKYMLLFPRTARTDMQGGLGAWHQKVSPSRKKLCRSRDRFGLFQSFFFQSSFEDVELNCSDRHAGPL